MLRCLVARLLILIPLWATSAATLAQTTAPVVESVAVTRHDDGWRLDADIAVDLNEQLRNAAERGLTLYFSADVIVTQPRWWWFDQQVLATERLWSISYNALIRQWRVSSGGLALPVASLDDALALVRHIRGWQIAPGNAFAPGERYQGQLRLRLDVTQLSRPLQVNAINSSAWALSTPWREFTIDVPDTGGAP